MPAQFAREVRGLGMGNSELAPQARIGDQLRHWLRHSEQPADAVEHALHDDAHPMGGAVRPSASIGAPAWRSQSAGSTTRPWRR